MGVCVCVEGRGISLKGTFMSLLLVHVVAKTSKFLWNVVGRHLLILVFDDLKSLCLKCLKACAQYCILEPCSYSGTAHCLLALLSGFIVAMGSVSLTNWRHYFQSVNTTYTQVNMYYMNMNM